MCVNEIQGSVLEMGILSLRKCWPKVAPPERLIFPKKHTCQSKGEEHSGCQHTGDNLHVLGSRRHTSWLSLGIWEILLEGGGPPWQLMRQGLKV